MPGEIKLRGDKALTRKLQSLAARTQNTIVRSAAGKAMTPVNRAAKQLAPKETGLLKKSVGKKTKTYPGKGTVWVGVGPRKGFAQEITVTGPDGKPVKRWRDPVKYAHLVEYGTAPHVQPKLGITHPGAPAKPFMRPALFGNQTKVEQILAKGVEDGVHKYARMG